MNYRYIAGLAAFGALFHVASAADSFFESETIFSIGYGGDAANNMTATLTGGGAYENFVANATGDGYNYGKSTNSFWDGSSSGFVYAQGGSHSDAFGSANEFQGMNFFINITNNSTFATGTFTVSELLERLLFADGASSYTVAYGGQQIYQAPDYPAGFYTNTLDSNGNFTGNGVGNYADDGNSVPPNYFEATGSMSAVLNPGETVGVQIWASGESHVLTPEPMTMGLGLGVLGLLARRRRKQA